MVPALAVITFFSAVDLGCTNAAIARLSARLQLLSAFILGGAIWGGVRITSLVMLRDDRIRRITIDCVAGLAGAALSVAVFLAAGWLGAVARLNRCPCGQSSC